MPKEYRSGGRRRAIFCSFILFFLGAKSGAESVPLEIIHADGTVEHDSIHLEDRFGNSGVARGQLIVVDTRDEKACGKVREFLLGDPSIKDANKLESLCVKDAERPFASIAVFREIDAVEFRKEIDLRFLQDTDKNLVNDTRNLALSMVGMMGLLWIMPESVSKWDKDEITQRGYFGKYVDNVTSPPVIDKDDWAVNYIGHPVSGAAYYTMARHAGLGKWESFGYSVLMSTFFWEYGFEAVAERPSVQDLIFTPVLGSLLGELFYQAEQRLVANGGKILGSETAGKVALVFLNPMGKLSDAINSAIGSKFIQDARAHWVMRTRRDPVTGATSDFFGLELRFMFD